MNTSIHMGDNKWSNIFILNCSFELIISSVFIAVEMGIVL